MTATRMRREASRLMPTYRRCMELDVDIEFLSTVHDIDDITFLHGKNARHTGGNVDASIGVKGYIRFPGVAEDALHRRMSFWDGTSNW